MSCILNLGYALPCREGSGGNEKLYLASYSATTSWSVDSNNIITGGTGYNQFFDFEVDSEILGFIENGAFTKFGGVYTQTLTTKLFNITQTERDILKLLSQTRVVCITKTNKGKYFLGGKVHGLWLTTVDITAGVMMEDEATITLTLLGKEANPADEVNSALITTLIA